MWTKELLKPIILNIIRYDLRHEANRILDACSDADLKDLIEYADKYLGHLDYDGNTINWHHNRSSGHDHFDNIAVMELDLLKSKLEYFGRIKKCESPIGLDKELISQLIERWRQEKLNQIIP